MTSEHFQSHEIELNSDHKRKFGIFPLRRVISFRNKQQIIDSIVDLADIDDETEIAIEYKELISALAEADDPNVKLGVAVQLMQEIEDTSMVDTMEIEPIIEEAAAEILEVLEAKENKQSQRYGGRERHYVGPGVGPRSAILAFEAYDALPCDETLRLAAYSVSHVASGDIREVFEVAWAHAQADGRISSIDALRLVREERENARENAWQYEHLYDPNETASPDRDAAA